MTCILSSGYSPATTSWWAKQITNFLERLHCEDSIRGEKISYSFDFLSPASKIVFDKMQLNVLNLNILERVLGNLMLLATDKQRDLCGSEPALAVL